MCNKNPKNLERLFHKKIVTVNDVLFFLGDTFNSGTKIKLSMKKQMKTTNKEKVI
jgi:hypothetical protein